MKPAASAMSGCDKDGRQLKFDKYLKGLMLPARPVQAHLKDVKPFNRHLLGMMQSRRPSWVFDLTSNGVTVAVFMRCDLCDAPGYECNSKNNLRFSPYEVRR